MTDYTNALAKFLQSEKQAFAEPQRMLWPFRKDPYTGDMGLGHSMFTESIQNGFNFPAKVMRGEVPLFAEYEDGKTHYSPEMIQGANDTAGLAMTGAIGLPKPQKLTDAAIAKNVSVAYPMEASGLSGVPNMYNWNSMIVNEGADVLRNNGASVLNGPTKNDFFMGGTSQRQIIPQTIDDGLYETAEKFGRGGLGEFVAGAPANDSFTTPFTGDRLLYSKPREGAAAAQATNVAERQVNGPTFYHATNRDFDVFDNAFRPKHGNDVGGFFFSDQARGASGYGANMKSARLNLGKSLELPQSQGLAQIGDVADARRNGYDSIIYTYDNGPGKAPLREYVVFDASQITTAANPREGAAAAYGTSTGQREEENALMNVLRQYGLY